MNFLNLWRALYFVRFLPGKRWGLPRYALGAYCTNIKGYAITVHVLFQYLQNRISHSRLLIRLVSHNYSSLYFKLVRLTGRPSFCVWFDSASLSEEHVRTSSITPPWFRTFELLTNLDEWNGSRWIMFPILYFDNGCENHPHSKMNFSIDDACRLKKPCLKMKSIVKL